MTYEEMKIFCNRLSPEQLNKDVYVSIVDGKAIKVDKAHISKEAEWFDHCDSMGFAKDMEDEFGENWKDEAEDYTLVPKGTVFLISENE